MGVPAEQSLVCTIQQDVDIYVAIRHGRTMADALGFNPVDRTRIEIAILELTRNLLAHAGGGKVIFEMVSQPTRKGIAIEARDEGPGIPDVALAMKDGFSTKNTLGAGLPGVRRLMDEFTIDSIPGKGTRVRAIKWVPQQDRGY